ncbi:sentrin-specific protease 8 [Latimeria chalumnae]|uniref:SUMO peptidase family member, NEDD8 specific n=1 Tax=Latimeria chalumnae TaxID=7897 RepID=H2ZVJ6_LATCH|nr:PREDICTED: sentrin-specific protease 8 [Latimeria chalumnae]XP_006013952.1 PREDICTED: sentrin-specific protease 8 [Latimeria chalumnae]|eukprot:XP_006013951.1 PREDICTED: sentrin-specific protease 8 [Latimeria chalumnae]
MDPVILSYNDSLLRHSDVSLLDPPKWLNDHIIGFTFEYFATDLFQDFCSSVCFIGPEVAQFIKCATSQEELAIFLESLDLPHKKLVFLPVNDNLNQVAGGTHWSLLVYNRDRGGFGHYDSYSGSNTHHARQIVEKLEPFLGKRAVRVPFVEEQAPSQQNSYDCGMYVICSTEVLCEEYLKGQPRVLLQLLTPLYITQKRAEYKRLIEKLAKK